jgi:hypothetical protein
MKVDKATLGDSLSRSSAEAEFASNPRHLLSLWPNATDWFLRRRARPLCRQGARAAGRYLHFLAFHVASIALSSSRTAM